MKINNKNEFYGEWVQMMVTIGVCIPTYQRGNITKESIKHIYENNKVLFDAGICHFYISDDCSKDDTFSILSNLNKEINCITIQKTECNLGFEGNNGRCIQMCEKDYAWLLGDDDTINVSIIELIEVLGNQEFFPDFIIIGKNRSIKEKIYDKKEEAIITLLYESTWMFGLLFKSTVIRQLNFTRYAEGKFPHAGAIFEYFGNNKSSIQYIYGPNWSSILRPGKVSYNGRILEVYARGWTNLVMGLPLCWDYQLKLKLLHMRGERGRDMLSNLILLSLRSQGQLDILKLKEYYPYIKLYNCSPYFVLYLISIMPKKPLKFLRKCYAKINGIVLMEQG